VRHSVSDSFLFPFPGVPLVQAFLALSRLWTSAMRLKLKVSIKCNLWGLQVFCMVNFTFSTVYLT